MRNEIGFWLLGLFNNFAYVIMLSAAHDLLHNEEHNITTIHPNNTDYLLQKDGYHSQDARGRDCNKMSTGSILLANILPAVCLKLIAPFLPIQAAVKVTFTCLLSAGSFIVVSMAKSSVQTLVGVALASLGSGLGEVTLLSFTHNFDPIVVSYWSSGTGGAGVLGAGTYSLLTQCGVTPRMAVLLMLFVPVGMFFTYFFLIKVPSHQGYTEVPSQVISAEQDHVIGQDQHELQQQLILIEKIRQIPSLFKYMIPLGIVYYFEYMINQGLFELLYFPESVFSHSQQYRWYQLDYQVGVLLSRSSLNFIKIKSLKMLAVLQSINFLVALIQSIYWTIPSIWIVFIFIFWEGLLGGAAYVNTFYRISTEVDERHKEFSLGISSLADSASIGFAGLASIHLHSWICSMPSPH